MAKKSEETLTAEAALATIREHAPYEEPLRRRAESLTWMIWGLATAGMFGANSTYVMAVAPLTTVSGSALLIMWFVAASLMTMGAYRLAGVAARSKVPWGKGVLAAVFLIGIFLSLSTMVEWWRVASPMGMVYSVGVPWLVLGLLPFRRITRTGRYMLIVIGSLQIAIGILLSFLYPGFAIENWDAAYVAATLVNGLVPFLGGVAQGLKG